MPGVLPSLFDFWTFQSNAVDFTLLTNSFFYVLLTTILIRQTFSGSSIIPKYLSLELKWLQFLTKLKFAMAVHKDNLSKLLVSIWLIHAFPMASSVDYFRVGSRKKLFMLVPSGNSTSRLFIKRPCWLKGINVLF